MSDKQDKYFNSNNIQDYFLATWGFLSFVMFPILAIILFLWEFEIFHSTDSKNLYFRERVIYGGSIFKKHHEINFKIYPETQTIIQTNEQPIFNEKFKKIIKLKRDCILSNIIKHNNNKKCQISDIDKDKVSYINSLPKFKQSITKLENCLIKDEENWICNSNIKHINLPIKFFGLNDGNWIIDKTYKSKIKKWKLIWYIDKFKCDETCYQMSLKQEELLRKKLKEKLKKQIIQPVKKHD